MRLPYNPGREIVVSTHAMSGWRNDLTFAALLERIGRSPSVDEAISDEALHRPCRKTVKEIDLRIKERSYIHVRTTYSGPRNEMENLCWHSPLEFVLFRVRTSAECREQKYLAGCEG